MDLVKFEQLNSRGFELRIEVVLVPTTDNEKVCSRILPKSFLVDLGVDPRTVLKQLLVKSVGAREITFDEAHHIMRYSKFQVVADLGGDEVVSY
jgi:hypothetical protein